MAEYKGILIIAELVNNTLAPISKELLGAGRKLAATLNEPVEAVLIGSGVAGAAPEAFHFGADKVYVVDNPVLKDYRTDSYVAAVAKVAAQANPRIILAGQTTIGRDLLPRLAFKLNSAATMDCIDLSVDAATKHLQMTKPVYGGNARALFTADSFPQMATVRAKAMSPIAADSSRKGDVINIDAGIDAAAVRTNVLQKVVAEVQGVKLEEAPVVVTGGRGIGGPDGFKTLEELAKILKGAVGASRPACDSGWVPDTMQVGLTGKIVSPDVYIAVGVSGASQHMAGCSGSKVIVAVNRDPEANIYQEARYGVIGDWKKIIPALTAKLKELLGR